MFHQSGPGAGSARGGQKRGKRLQAWCLAWEESLARSLKLSAEQHADVHKLLIKQSALSQQTWKKQPLRQQGLSATTVIRFAGGIPPVIRAVDRAIPELLTDEQMVNYLEIKAVRKKNRGLICPSRLSHHQRGIVFN